MTDDAYRAKRELQEYRDIDRRIGVIGERISRLMLGATRATSSVEAERVSGTGRRSRVESAVVTMIDLQNQLSAEEERLRAKCLAITAAINAMSDSREKVVLEMRYLLGMSWAAIMTRLEMGERNSYLVHEAALQHFAEIYF